MRFTPNSYHLSRTILLAIFATMIRFIGFIGFNEAATAEIVADRKVGFKASATSMKAMAAAIGGGNYLTVINQAETISSWAQKIPSYFPEGSGLGNTGARAEIWVNFDNFTLLSKANETAANRLVLAAKSADPGAMMAGLKSLGAVVRFVTDYIKIKTT